MATYLDELKDQKLYKRQFFLPINEEDKKHNSLIFLLSNSFLDSHELMASPFVINRLNLFQSYYMEMNVKYLINTENNLIYRKNASILNEDTNDTVSNYKIINDKDRLETIGLDYYIEENIRNDKDMEIFSIVYHDKFTNRYVHVASIGIKNKSIYYSKIVYTDSIEAYKILVQNALNSGIKYADETDDMTVNILKSMGFEETDTPNRFKYNKSKNTSIPANVGKVQVQDDSTELFLLDLLESTDIKYKKYNSIYNDAIISENGGIVFTPDKVDSILESQDSNNSNLKKLLYKERARNNKSTLRIYKSIKESNPNIKKTYTNLSRYKELNLFVDTYYYMDIFSKNNRFKPNKSIEIYYTMVSRMINDERYTKAGYKIKTVFIPVWKGAYGGVEEPWDYLKYTNILSMLTKFIRTSRAELSDFDGYTFVFIGKNGYFKMTNFDISYLKFVKLIKSLYDRDIVDDREVNKDSAKAIKEKIINSIEKQQNVEINNLVGSKSSKNDIIDSIDNAETSATDYDEKEKEKLVDVVDSYSKKSSTPQSAIDKIKDNEYDNEYVNNILKNISKSSPSAPTISHTRLARMEKLNNKFLDSSFGPQTKVKQIIYANGETRKIPKKSVPIETINDEWKNLTGAGFEEAYDIDQDIYNILYFFSELSYPVSIRDLNKEDTSTTEDSVYTYTVSCEDSFGTQFGVKFDIPKFRDNRFMKLRGNEKTINAQLVLLPIIKTDENTAQIVTSYKKIFIRRFGNTAGKSMESTDRLVKALSKYKGNEIIITEGDNSRICSKYELPIDYIDLASMYSKIEVRPKNNKDRYIFYFNQDELNEKINSIKDNKYKDDNNLAIGIKNNKEIIYAVDDLMPSICISSILRSYIPEFSELYSQAKPSTKYVYSKASILNSEIPVIVVMGYTVGLTEALDKSKVDYELVETRPKHVDGYDIIRFNDAYLVYKIDYASSLLMNGLKECDTENYSIKDVNGKEMWLDFLDIFGGRIHADGLDNFADLTMDPITKEVCGIYSLPKDYIEALAYANMLLADNKYNKHVDITGNRLRTNEIIAKLVYEELCKSYEQYKFQVKRGKKAKMTMKQSAVIDNLIALKTCNDLSVFNPLMEYEAANTVSFKGPSGMNNDRSYGLDKRAYDKSMIGVLALSTGFAANVGLNRQATIDKNIMGKRGLIKPLKPEEMNTTKALCMTEALTPYGTTHDDPFRSGMTFIQTSKHNMRTKKSSPLLVTNGADEALPYLSSSMFSVKAKQNGVIDEVSDNYIKITYDNGEKDFVDLRETTRKNSDGGVYEVLKLDTDLKPGNKIKAGQIIAYDRQSFSEKSGKNDIAYNEGPLVKLAILNTDSGFEDSAILSEYLSDALSSRVVVKKQILLDAKSSIYKMAKKGQEIQEGETLMIFQNPFDDEDANALVNTITDPDAVSEIGRIPIKSKVTGIVQNIIITRTAELEDMSPSLRKCVKQYEDGITKLKKELKDYSKNENEIFEPNYKLPPTGKMKNAPNHVLIEFFLAYDDKFKVGDKLVYYSALKGTSKTLFPKGDEPYSTFRPDEKIDSLLAVGSINGRMVGSIISTGSLNKLVIELTRKVRDIIGLDIPLDDYKE